MPTARVRLLLDSERTEKQSALRARIPLPAGRLLGAWTLFLLRALQEWTFEDASTSTLNSVVRFNQK